MKIFKTKNGGFLGFYLLVCFMVLYGASLTSVQAFEPIEQPSVRLSIPKGGESWVLGQTKEIRWIYTGPEAASQRWKLVLIKGQNAIGTIADNVSGDRYNWKVGQYTGGIAPLGSDYKVWIVNVASGQVKDASDSFFEIKFVSVGVPLQEQKTKLQQPKPASQEPIFKQKPKLDVRKPNLTCSVEAFYDSYCTQKIPSTGYDYQTAPSPKFIYFLVKIKNLGGPANDIDWEFRYEEGYWGKPPYPFGVIPPPNMPDVRKPTWIPRSSTIIHRKLHLWGLAANEEYRFTNRSNRVEPYSNYEKTYMKLEAWLDVRGNIDEESEQDNSCSCFVEVKW